MIFKGEFLNEIKWNGKFDVGTEINNEIKNGGGYLKKLFSINKSCFEREYLNGKRKQYYYGTFLYEGEYLNNERNGKGKENNINAQFKYEGKYLNGKRNGKGKELLSNGKFGFEGDYLYNHRIKGKEYINGKLVY